MPENAQNLILRYDYRIHLQEAQGSDVKTIDAVMRAIAEFERFVAGKDFAKLGTDDVIAFKRYIVSRPRQQGDDTLSLSSLLHILYHLKGFFAWLRTREGYRRMDPDVASFFRPPRRHEMSARSPAARLGPSLETVEQVISSMARDTLAQRRNRAAIALILVTAARDGALVSLRRKHLQFELRQLVQNGREVSTKFGTNHLTWFFPVSAMAEAIVADWVTEIDDLGFGPEDPLFPREIDQIRHPGVSGEITRVPWATAAPLRASLKEACSRAAVPYFNPHAIRKTIAVIGEQRARTPFELKAWSQNLGHKSVRTTLESYGTLHDDQVGGTISTIGKRGEITEVLAMLETADIEKQRIIYSILKMGS